MSNLHYFNRDWIKSDSRVIEVDVCVYGGTSAGVIAAVTVARQGRSVVLLNPGLHLGGMSSGGLGWTDYGKKYVIGGASRRFYNELGKHYGKSEEWHFEPHVAERLFNQRVKDAGVPVHHAQYLDKVFMEGGRIARVAMLGGLTVKARFHVDATYEGDLLAKAGVSCTVGREGNSRYGEKLNGVQIPQWHQFGAPVDPYVVEGDPSSGMLPHIEKEDFTTKIGAGDHRVQAYNFRVCMTDDPALKVDWAKPPGFDPREYALASRWLGGELDHYNNQLLNWKGEPTAVPRKFDVFPNKTPGGHRKTDTNNHGAVSSDFIGANWAWPQGDYETRERIFQAHVAYQRGLYWFIANDPSIPKKFREAYGAWGLPRDEFEDTEHWPHQLYVREARRMVSDYVITEADCMGTSRPQDPVGMGSYNLDSHNCTRFVKVENGRARVLNEGDVQVKPTDPYPISYRSIVPRKGECCANLFVPVCLSASHIAYGSARMEPVFMALAESAGIAAALCLREKCGAQELPYAALRPELEKAGQVLALPPADQRK